MVAKAFETLAFYNSATQVDYVSASVMNEQRLSQLRRAVGGMVGFEFQIIGGPGKVYKPYAVATSDIGLTLDVLSCGYDEGIVPEGSNFVSYNDRLNKGVHGKLVEGRMADLRLCDSAEKESLYYE